MERVLELATSYPIWMIAMLIIGIVIFQAVIFIRLATKTSESVGLDQTEVKSALRVGAVAAIGPAMGSMIIAISLITFLGEPLTLMRSAVIGSSAIEAMGANLAAQAYGTELGSAGFNEQAFTTIVWTLCLGGLGWLLFVVFFIKPLSKAERKVSTNSSSNKGNLIAIISSAAMLGVFGNFVIGEVLKGFTTTIVIFASAVTMFILFFLSNKLKMNWIKEWSLGLSILVSLAVSYFITL
jgi:Domain of unknown function (DUF5058)